MWLGEDVEYARPPVAVAGAGAYIAPWDDADYGVEVDPGVALLSMGSHSRAVWAGALAVLTN